MLEEGSLSCPGCGGRLAGWGHGRKRVVFGPGRQTRREVRPRRSRCTACRVTHMLLPAAMLARRADEARVIGAALAAAARGRGLRRFAARAGQIREIFTGVAAAVSADPVPLAPAGPAVADAVVAVAAAAAAAGGRWPQLLAVSPWEIASAVTSASLLAPAITARAVHTNWPLVT